MRYSCRGNRYVSASLRRQSRTKTEVRFTVLLFLRPFGRGSPRAPIQKEKPPCWWFFFLAGVTGFEPMMTESESVALPLGDTPKRNLLTYHIKRLKKLQAFLTEFKNFYKFLYFRRRELCGGDIFGQFFIS